MLGLAKRVRARILQASTSEVYGDPEVHPQVREEGEGRRGGEGGKMRGKERGRLCFYFNFLTIFFFFFFFFSPFLFQTEDYWGRVNPIGIRSCYDEVL